MASFAVYDYISGQTKLVTAPNVNGREEAIIEAVGSSKSHTLLVKELTKSPKVLNAKALDQQLQKEEGWMRRVGGNKQLWVSWPKKLKAPEGPFEDRKLWDEFSNQEDTKGLLYWEWYKQQLEQFEEEKMLDDNGASNDEEDFQECVADVLSIVASHIRGTITKEVLCGNLKSVIEEMEQYLGH